MARISERKRERALDLINTRYQAAWKYQKPLFDKFVEYYQVYRAVRDRQKQNYHGKANLFIPYVYANIENAYPKMIASKPKLNIFPRENGDIYSAQVLTKLIDYQWYTLRMKNVMKDWVKQGLLYGTSPIKVTWEFNEAMNRDDLRVEVVPIYDFFVDPDATSDRQARYVIHQVWRDIETLRANKNYSLPKELIAKSRNYSEYETRIDSIKQQSRETNADNNQVKLWEYWGLFDLDGSGEEKECLITIADEKYVIRIQENPFKHQKKPFVTFRDVLVPNEYWAIGEIEPLISLQYELNDTRNQRMDNVTQILRNQPIISRQTNVRPYDLENWQNGDALFVDGPAEGAVGFARPPDVTASGYNEETMIKGDLQFISSLVDVSPTVGARYAKSISQETATGAALQAEESNARFRAKLDNLEDSLTELGSQIIALNQQFIDQERIIRVLGEDGTAELFSVRPDDIRGDFDLIVEAGATQAMNKQIKRAETLQLFATLAPFAGAVIDPKWLVKLVIDSYDIEDKDQAFVQQTPMTNQQPSIPGVPASLQGQQQPAPLQQPSQNLSPQASTTLL